MRGKATPELEAAFSAYINEIDSTGEGIHSVMILKNGKVVEEKFFGDWTPDKPHTMWSVSKSFTATAVGLAISDGLLTTDTKVLSIFPEYTNISEDSLQNERLSEMTVRDLLTMSCGHDADPTGAVKGQGEEWLPFFFKWPLNHEPGTYFCYNSVGTYVLSAIVQKLTGQKTLDYLQERLFDPLSIEKPEWEESPQGINCGGWGLSLKTEDMAKFGQMMLQEGQWNGKQIVPKEWVEEMSSYKVESRPAGVTPEQVIENGWKKEDSDWLQGYCYQMWRCRHNAYRADGAFGQYIIVIPDKQAVVALTSNTKLGMQSELDAIWKHLLPAL